MSTVQKARDGYFHPSSVEEIQALVLDAKARKRTIRVRGAGHSVNQAVYTDSFPYETAEYYAPSEIADNYALNFQPVEVPDNEINILLDRFIDVHFYEEHGKHYVKACAGCHLGRDPYDPTETSTYFNSLFYQMDQRGFAVPDMGGITHQTVGGFLSTGSSGGSLKYSIEDAIVAFSFVDGNGEHHHCSKFDENTDLFYAIGVSMGLLGIITHVTFECMPRYSISGSETTTYESDCEVDLFGNGSKGKPSLEKFLRDTEYTRLMWWPQKKVEKMVVWKAARVPGPVPTPYIPQPYIETPEIFGSPTPLQYVGALFYNAVVTWPASLYQVIKNATLAKILKPIIELIYEPFLLPFVINIFVQNDDTKPGGKPQEFHDLWWRGLPMDNQVDDRLLHVIFTELWMPIEQTQAAMVALNNFYDKGGYKATGYFSNEIYGTKASKFWMSPAFERDVVRFDIFVYSDGENEPYDFYTQYWDLLKPFNFRAHWAKYLPGQPYSPVQLKEWYEYFRQQNPRWDDWMALRAKHDPDQIFVNAYWRTRLQIGPLQPSDYPPAPSPRPKPQPGPDPDPTPISYYIASIFYTLLISTAVEMLGSNVLDIFRWTSPTVEITIIAIMTLGIGVGNVLFRRSSGVWMLLLTFAAVLVLNVANGLLDERWWTWHAELGLPPWLVGVVFESFVAVAVCYVSRKLGEKFFRQHTAK
ncbi:MAG: FAD-binding protein [Bacteroidetes bacterium]|nr:FAD-binding protein [Bacteroidota bacterium]